MIQINSKTLHSVETISILKKMKKDDEAKLAEVVRVLESQLKFKGVYGGIVII